MAARENKHNACQFILNKIFPESAIMMPATLTAVAPVLSFSGL
ncbi:hypothetical protein AB28_0846 [Raoultella ornithinolytica 2-156-04_S1_C2]|jgi:hypothetical protein|nr:hypothetical protein AB00_0838 [Raoultella ornithinolytica 2-156-04_S1_C1]KDX16094.1 hypothetical protein AB28_0846 [Raoultella ornithinolytica 2-156-04_S1_C2]